MLIFASSMINRLLHIFVWLSRIHCCRGFGIQSPTDYAFVRYVINEHWQYRAYERLGSNDSWLKRKLGLLYFRLANWRQAQMVIDRVGAKEYVNAGCKHSQVVDCSEKVELAFVGINDNVKALYEHCDDGSVIVVEGIRENKRIWKALLADSRVTISYDLFYCGILMFDSGRVKQHYKINF